jgi:hypothetical protein
MYQKRVTIVCLTAVLSCVLVAGIKQSTGFVCNSANPSGSVTWSVLGDERTGVSTNGLPRYKVYDYCPFGAGGLYCGTYAWCPSRDYGVAGELCMPAGFGSPFDSSSGSPWGAPAADASTACSGQTANWVLKPCPTGTASGTGHYDCPTTQATTYTLPANPLPVSNAIGPSCAFGSNIGTRSRARLFFHLSYA